jgi:hypothetical protein
MSFLGVVVVSFGCRTCSGKRASGWLFAPKILATSVKRLLSLTERDNFLVLRVSDKNVVLMLLGLQVD